MPNAVDRDAHHSLRRATVAAAIALGVVVADQLTKVWAASALTHHPRSIVGTTVELRLSRNTGSAFSLFRGFTPLLALVAVVVVFLLFRAVPTTADRVTLVALGLVLGGSLGNLVDRVARSPGFLRGAVVDFVDIGPWPVFNVADAAITVGALLLAVAIIRGEVSPSRSAAPGRGNHHRA